MIKTQLKIVHQAMHQSKFGEAQNATTDSLLTFLSVAGVRVQFMVSRPILALRSHRRETGAEAEVLWSLCCSPAPLALQDPFWFYLRDDAMPYNTWLLRKGLIFFPQLSGVS